jgi:hypothetical protein
MTEFVVTTDTRSYRVVRDALLDFRALIVGRAMDELTNRPPLDRARVQATLRGISPDAPGEGNRFASTTGLGGTFAISGEVDRVFPNLAATGYVVDLVVDAPGYLHTPVAVPVPAGTIAFPLDAGSVLLRRDAVALKGRVATGVPPAGVAGATVSIVAPAGLVGLQAPLAFPHAAGLTLTPQALGPTGPALELRADIHAGATRVPLASRAGLAVNAILRLGDAGVREYAIVAGLEGPSDLARPGAALLRAPVAFPHRAGDVEAQRVVPGAAGPAATLTQGAFAEDRVAFVDDPTLLPDDGTALAAHLDPTRQEWVVVRRPTALTDAAGDYRLRPVGRAATLTVHVAPGGPPPPDHTHIVSYGQPENTLNLRV